MRHRVDRVSVVVFLFVAIAWFTITFVPILLIGIVGPLLYDEGGVPLRDESGLAYEVHYVFAWQYGKTMMLRLPMILCLDGDSCGWLSQSRDDHWIAGGFVETALNSLLWASVITLLFVGVRTLIRVLRDLFSTDDPMERVRNLSLWEAVGVIVLALALAVLPLASCLVISYVAEGF